MEVAFKALEYTVKDSFIESEYRFTGNTDTGWTITRNGREHAALGPGYRLLQTIYCGICSTDLARRFLPFLLPQVIGHEAVARDTEGRAYVIEINDTCAARGDETPEIFCRSGLPTHCPGRMVLGIDRLPGGFGPWVLAPVNAVIPLDDLPLRAAVLVEPFAAALHAVTTSAPRSGDKTAVVGSGRLGLLIVAALASYRTNAGYDFTITALDRNGRNLDRARAMGADNTISLTSDKEEALREQFDLVFDASGSPDGFDTALDLARREVHLKSTHGREYHGVRHLTELVVDELALLPFSSENLDFHWEGENRRNARIFIATGADISDIPGRFRMLHGDFQSAEALLKEDEFRDSLPRFDIAVASSAAEIDLCIRPSADHEESLVRPRGAILFKGDAGDNPLLRFLASGKRVRTTRCGDFRQSLDLLKKDRMILSLMEQQILTHEYSASRLPQAFETAKSPDSIKVIIRHV